MTFADKIVVITGAGSGIGRSLARGFARDGATIVGFGRRAEALEQTADACGPDRMHVVAGDVTQADDVARLAAQVEQRFERVDILVNNAAVYPRGGFLDEPLDAWVQAMQINVIGMARCCHALLPGMLSRGHGRVLNLGSYAWMGPLPGSSAYSVSKAGVHALTKALAAEIDSTRYPDVLVNELNPGAVRTSMSDEGKTPDAVYPYARAMAQLPRGGPHGQVFLEGELQQAPQGLRARLRGRLARALGSR